MKNLITYKGQVTQMKRMKSSVNGNPRYSVTVDNIVTACTAPDSSLGYTVKNIREGDRVEMVMGTHYGRQTIDSITKV